MILGGTALGSVELGGAVFRYPIVITLNTTLSITSSFTSPFKASSKYDPYNRYGDFWTSTHRSITNRSLGKW